MLWLLINCHYQALWTTEYILHISEGFFLQKKKYNDVGVCFQGHRIRKSTDSRLVCDIQPLCTDWPRKYCLNSIDRCFR